MVKGWELGVVPFPAIRYPAVRTSVVVWGSYESRAMGTYLASMTLSFIPILLSLSVSFVPSISFVLSFSHLCFMFSVSVSFSGFVFIVLVFSTVPRLPIPVSRFHFVVPRVRVRVRERGCIRSTLSLSSFLSAFVRFPLSFAATR